jgi:hypothetical protein
MPSLLRNDEKHKNTRIADIFNSFFLSVAENLNLHQVGERRPNFFFN